MTQLPEVCIRCDKRHPTPWLHKGDCSNCFRRPGVIGRPVIRRKGHQFEFCQECWAEIDVAAQSHPPMTEQEEADLFARMK